MMDLSFVQIQNLVEQDPIRNTYIQYSKIKRMINKIPAKEILVMLGYLPWRHI